MEKVCPICDKNSSKDIHTTTLRSSAFYGHADCVKVLIKAGADVNTADVLGKTALMYAAQEGHTEHGSKALILGANYAECVGVLIGAGADVNTSDNSGHTALIYAALYGSVDGMKLLVEAGAYVNPEDRSVKELLLRATAQGHFEYLKLLIEAGTDVNAVYNQGITALMWAVLKGHDKCVDLLIKSGADVNAVDMHHRTALMYVSGADNSIECVKLLLRAEVHINIRQQGLRENPLMYLICFHGNLKDIIMLLFAAGETINGTTVKATAAFFNLTKGAVAHDYLLHQDPQVNQRQARSQCCTPITTPMFATVDGTTVLAGDIFSTFTKTAPVPDYLLHEDLKLNLKHLCREAIREHLINIDPHQHLFGRIPKLGLPSILQDYLLYNMSLDDDDDDDDDDDNM